MVDSSDKKITLEESNVENVKSLMAIYNLNEDKLNGVLDLGGIPYPRISIAKPSIYNNIRMLWNYIFIN